MTSTGIRARDVDRVEACGLLDAAHAEGQLTDTEHATRTDRAMRSVTFDQLAMLVGDLQIPVRYAGSAVVRPDRRPRVPRPGGPRRWAGAAGLVAAAAGVGALAGSCASGLVSSAPDVPNLTTGAGIQRFIEDYRAHFGDTLADEVLLFPERGAVDRRSDTDPGRYVGHSYDGEFDTWGVDSDRPRDTRTLDLGGVDVAAIARLVAGAPETLRLPDGEVSQVRFQFGTNDRLAEPVVAIYVTDAVEYSTFMTVGFDGEILRVYPPD
ncbi:DUF1707 domain-containing protein [Rhodococcus sp. NPDC058532]|uniref:DUF1707 SHOCT-like domain-containing protein n=1 Tax=Rhodococcus sp. NPDC058532 TaxID=3346540 RepID=UPI003656D9BE